MAYRRPGFPPGWVDRTLEVTLLGLNKKAYALREEVIYEVALKNISDDVLVIPWDPDWRRVEKGAAAAPPPGYVWGVISLLVEGEGSGLLRFGNNDLYGSNLADGSRKRLNPGQEVRVRAPGQWRLTNRSSDDVVPSELPRTVQVKAQFNFLYPPDSRHWYNTVLSSNSIDIQLTPPEPPGSR